MKSSQTMCFVHPGALVCTVSFKETSALSEKPPLVLSTPSAPEKKPLHRKLRGTRGSAAPGSVEATCGGFYRRFHLSSQDGRVEMIRHQIFLPILRKKPSRTLTTIHYTGLVNKDPYNGLLDSPYNWVV